MSLRQYIIALALGTAISISSWCIVTLAIDPAHAGALGLLVFYTTLGAGIAGLFTIVGTIVRARNAAEDAVHDVVTRSFRQGILLAILVIVSLVLLSKDLFSFGMMILFILLLGLVEFLALAVTRK